MNNNFEDECNYYLKNYMKDILELNEEKYYG